MPGNVDAVEDDGAGIGAQQQVEMLEQDGLAAAAGADDGGDFAGGKIEGDAVEHLLAAEAAVQIAHFDRVGGAGRVASLRDGRRVRLI